MTHLRNDYANVLTEKTILYVPSCLIVEMLTKLHSQVATINLSGSLHNVTPDLLILLRRMRHNLHVTAEAYEQGRIRFFIGDWRDDKLRARKLFFNTMSSLGYISELLERVERNMLFAAIESVTAEWTALDRLIDAGAEERKCPGGVCEAFCDCNSDSWREAMAKQLLSAQAGADGASADCLLLVCYTRAKRQLASSVENAARDSVPPVKIDPDRILSVSKERVPVICRKCVEPVFGAASGIPVPMPGGAGRIGAYELRAHPSTRARHGQKKTSRTTAAQPRRHVMPPSLASLCPGKD